MMRMTVFSHHLVLDTGTVDLVEKKKKKKEKQIRTKNETQHGKLTSDEVFRNFMDYMYKNYRANDNNIQHVEWREWLHGYSLTSPTLSFLQHPIHPLSHSGKDRGGVRWGWGVEVGGRVRMDGEGNEDSKTLQLCVP